MMYKKVSVKNLVMDLYDQFGITLLTAVINKWVNSSVGLFLFVQAPTFIDIVEPNERFEDCILGQQPLGDDNDVTIVLAEFPDDDIEVTNIPQAHRTIGPPVPDNAQ